MTCQFGGQPQPQAPLRSIIVCSTHRVAQAGAARNGHTALTFTSVTDPRRLRSLRKDTPLTVIDTDVPFTDICGMNATLARFSNVRHVLHP